MLFILLLFALEHRCRLGRQRINRDYMLVDTVVEEENQELQTMSSLHAVSVECIFQGMLKIVSPPPPPRAREGVLV